MKIQGQKTTTTATGGKWSVHLDTLTKGGPFTMTLTGDNTVTVNNLLVGEVSPEQMLRHGHGSFLRCQRRQRGNWGLVSGLARN